METIENMIAGLIPEDAEFISGISIPATKHRKNDKGRIFPATNAKLKISFKSKGKNYRFVSEILPDVVQDEIEGS